MGKIEFVVSWVKIARNGSRRHYASYKDSLPDAQKKARKVAAGENVVFCRIRQQEDNSGPDCLRVRILAMNLPY